MTALGPPAATDDAANRIVAPRRRLPGTRATVGGLLVAVAALLVFTAARPATQPPRTRYVVTTHAVPAGAIVRAADVTTVAVDLPPAVADRTVRSAARAVGSVALAPLAAHQLVAGSAVSPRRPGAARAVLSFAIDADRAAGGELVAGDRIDLLVTWSHESEATTEVVGHDLDVLSVRRADDHGLGRAAQLTLSIAVPSRDRMVPLVRAVRSGELTVVRTTGVAAVDAATGTSPAEGSTGAATATPSEPAAAAPVTSRNRRPR